MALTAQELQLIESLKFPLAAAERIHQETGGVLEEAKSDEWDYRDDDEESGPIRGVSVLLPNAAVESFVETQQTAMEALGCRAFWSTRRQANGLQSGDELVVLPTTDMMEAIRWSHSNGGNYGVSMEDIIDRISRWRTLCDVQVVGAAHDWVALRFHTLPENICQFAEDVFELCPDSVHQGVALQYEEDEEALEAARTLCPDICITATTAEGQLERMTKGFPPEMVDQLREKLSQTMNSPRMKAMLEIVGNHSEPSEEDGVRLLAYEIRRSGYLFLWWD
ncbi:hypothetical protein CCAX7_29130 [Capsulimonas corticalis]|uniref:Uncharacterized protein n=1 Tax=Capsulimonas corticalis TaxID=2219043 RepID=A0A402CT50_9BACT|nr:DUF4253 domain-containing protein [Capsulimonas corticalis]BDI30862.1 hypothetical protein CCAX7_29130 [Capsulimonas corticalis]